MPLNGRQKEIFLHQGENQHVVSLCSFFIGSLYFGSSSDKTVCIWSRAGGNFSFLQQLHGHEGCVAALSWSNYYSGVLASGSVDLSIRLWAADESWKCIRILKGHTDAITSIAWSPTLPLLASGSRDRSIRVHNAGSAQQLQLIKMSADNQHA